MSALFDRLKLLFDEGHGLELPGLRSDAGFAPPEIRPAAVLIAVTDRPEPGVILGGRLTVGQTALDRFIGVRIPASQPIPHPAGDT